jgi:hypothetical protein
MSAFAAVEVAKVKVKEATKELHSHIMGSMPTMDRKRDALLQSMSRLERALSSVEYDQYNS